MKSNKTMPGSIVLLLFIYVTLLSGALNSKACKSIIGVRMLFIGGGDDET